MNIRPLVDGILDLYEDCVHEIILVNDGSTDGTAAVMAELAARDQRVKTLHRSKYVIMGDSDESYDFSALFPFVEKLRAGYDLVMGNRFRGRIVPGAMPPMHQYFGNPFLTAIGRLFFSCKECGDLLRPPRFPEGSGASIAAAKSRDGVCPRDDRQGTDARSPHYRGSHHAFSPRPRPGSAPSLVPGWLEESSLLPSNESRCFFGIPGLTLLAGGLIVSMVLLTGPISVMSITFDYHTLMIPRAEKLANSKVATVPASEDDGVSADGDFVALAMNALST